MSGVWSVPEVELTAEEHTAYLKMLDSDTLTFATGGLFPKVYYFAQIEEKARVSYAPKADTASNGDRKRSYAIWMAGVISLSRDENSALRRTWYRLIAAGCEITAEELFWQLSALEPSARGSLGALAVKDLGTFAGLDEWGMQS